MPMPISSLSQSLSSASVNLDTSPSKARDGKSAGLDRASSVTSLQVQSLRATEATTNTESMCAPSARASVLGDVVPEEAVNAGVLDSGSSTSAGRCSSGDSKEQAEIAFWNMPAGQMPDPSAESDDPESYLLNQCGPASHNIQIDQETGIKEIGVFSYSKETGENTLSEGMRIDTRTNTFQGGTFKGGQLVSGERGVFSASPKSTQGEERGGAYGHRLNASLVFEERGTFGPNEKTGKVQLQKGVRMNWRTHMFEGGSFQNDKLVKGDTRQLPSNKAEFKQQQAAKAKELRTQKLTAASHKSSVALLGDFANEATLWAMYKEPMVQVIGPKKS